MTPATRVTSVEGLMRAIADKDPVIEVVGSLEDVPSLRLPAGQVLQGGSDSACLRFRKGSPGLLLHSDNRLTGLSLETDLAQVALGLADVTEDLGVLEISTVRTIGCVHLEAQRALAGRLILRDIHVAKADARLAAHRPQGFGVEVLLGAMTVYNSSKDPRSHWQVTAEGLTAGSPEQPVRGSGIFIFGGDYIAATTDPENAPGPDTAGGLITLERLSTGAVWSDGGIPQGVGNLITGGVFVGSGVKADHVVCEGAVTTFGQNDMVLDNWGEVVRWEALAPLVSHGASGIGFVNFGGLASLEVQAPITTYGLGARGFNLYDGTLGTAMFQKITTHGDGAIGIQLSKPFTRITVAGDVITHGGSGDSLVRGKVVNLKAHALSLKAGTRGEWLAIMGKADACHPDIPALDLEGGRSGIETIVIGGTALP